MQCRSVLPVSLALVVVALRGADGLKRQRSFELVSQTFQCDDVRVKVNQPDLPTPQQTMRFAIDMDSLCFRTDSTTNTSVPTANISSVVVEGKIMDFAARRMTAYNEATVRVNGVDQVRKTCTYSEFPAFHEPAVVRQCIQTALAKSKSTGSEGNLTKYEHTLELAPGTSMRFTAYTDTGSVIKQVVADMDVQALATNLTEHLVYTDMDAKGGTPDASLFTAPAAWGPCTAGPRGVAPPFPPFPALKEFLECIGFESGAREQESLPVV